MQGGEAGSSTTATNMHTSRARARARGGGITGRRRRADRPFCRFRSATVRRATPGGGDAAPFGNAVFLVFLVFVFFYIVKTRKREFRRLEMLESEPGSRVVRGAWQTAESGRNQKTRGYDSGASTNWRTIAATNMHTSRACARARGVGRGRRCKGRPSCRFRSATVRRATPGGEMRRHSEMLFFLFFSFSRFSI